MLKCLSGVTDETLQYYLDRIREIAHLGDEAAKIEADKLIWEIFELKKSSTTHQNNHNQDGNSDDSDDDWGIEDTLDSLKQIEKKLRKKTRIFHDEIEYIRDNIEELHDNSNITTNNKYFTKLLSIDEKAASLLSNAEINAELYDLEDSLMLQIHNVSSVKSIIRRLDEHTKFFREKGNLSEEILKRIRNGKERAAWIRANKKIAEADVIAAGGALKKSASLKKEAEVLLTQDWEMAFPNENPPTINL